MRMEIDADKRDKTMRGRGLDFARAGEVFAGKHLTREDVRESYPEPRFQTVGWLDGRIVMLVWTPRGEVRRIISLRKTNDRETEKILPALG